MRAQSRTIASALVGSTLAALIVIGIRQNADPAGLILMGGASVVFLGSAVSSLIGSGNNRIRSGVISLGIVAIGLLLAGSRTEIVVGTAIIAAVSALELGYTHWTRNEPDTR